MGRKCGREVWEGDEEGVEGEGEEAKNTEVGITLHLFCAE